ncbi:MAG: DNA primase [bacterium]
MSRDQIEEIKQKIDIASIVQEYVPTLKRNGRNYFGLCPFHNEKTPSFSVNSELGIYKCFGCGEAGDVFKFVEQMESYDFPKVLDILAKRAGVTLEKTYSEKDSKLKSLREKVIAVNTLATQYFQYILTKHPSGESAREYVKRRQLNDKVIKDYQLGYAPTGYTNLMNFLLKKGYNKQELVQMGLLVEKNGKIYDKFRDRLMFPIANHQGDIVGFSGRIIDKNSLAPKYLNSPETPVYKKSEILFGLFQAKASLRKEKKAIIVEGNVDILSSYRVGVENIVAPLGTALTEMQTKLLRRYADEVLVCFNTDAAGVKALVRSLEILENAELAIRVIDLGEFKDVDELIIAGKDWKKAVAETKDAVIYLIDKLADKYNLHEASGIESYLREVLGIIRKIKSPIKTEHYLQMLSNKTQISEDLLSKQLAMPAPRQALNQVSGAAAPKYLDLVKMHFRQAYILALLYHYPDWFTAELKQLVADIIDIPELGKILVQGFDKLNPDEYLLTLQKEIMLLSVEKFETEQDFLTEISKELKLLKKEKIQKVLKYDKNLTEEEIMKYSQELAAIGKK